MPKNIADNNITIGDVVFSWSVKEYEQYVRDRRWYLIAGGIGALLLVYAVLAANYLFALVVILFAIVMYLHDIQTPIDIPFAITTTGIVLGSKYYRYSELNNFWIIYNQNGVKNLYFSLNGAIKHRLQVPFLDTDPIPVRDYLLQYLPEDLEQEEEPLSDTWARILKIH
jgi:hypothetical protein